MSEVGESLCTCANHWVDTHVMNSFSNKQLQSSGWMG